MPNIHWENYIHCDPQILVGKPVIKGTRISVEFLIALLGQGWSIEQILSNYPSLTQASIQAVFQYIAECMKEEYFYSIPKETTRDVAKTSCK